jgi:hypothetical protein
VGEPGPGYYDPKPVFNRTSSPDFSRTQGRPDITDSSVGPGYYSPSRVLTQQRSPSWKMEGKAKEQVHATDNIDFHTEKEFGKDAPMFKIHESPKVSPAR